MNLKVEAHLTAVADLITLVFLWSSAPYLMGAFVFVANCSFWSLDCSIRGRPSVTFGQESVLEKVN